MLTGHTHASHTHKHTRKHTRPPAHILPAHIRHARRTRTHPRPCAHTMHTRVSSHVHTCTHTHTRRTHIHTYTSINARCGEKGTFPVPGDNRAGGPRTWAGFGLEAPESRGQAGGLWADRSANTDPGKGLGDPRPAVTASAASWHLRGEALGLLHPHPTPHTPGHHTSFPLSVLPANSRARPPGEQKGPGPAASPLPASLLGALMPISSLPDVSQGRFGRTVLTRQMGNFFLCLPLLRL